MTVLGELTVVMEDEAVTGIYFENHEHLPDESAFGAAIDATVDATSDELLQTVKREIDEYLSGERTEFSVALQPHGSQFSLDVWALLQEIPYGHTQTYGQLAEKMGNRHLVQRVGQVVGRNPLSIFIPCHRVIGADGSLTGYAGGLDRKRFLLELEEPAEASAARLF
nr:methylated-DNA--[protein]-cysteine S-methyltransferase [Corynebacterium ammoniagenes]